MSYIGIRGAERLDRNDPSLSLLKAHDQAVRMLANGTDLHAIKQQTGWEVGVDGKWRYEIEDPFHTTTEIEAHIKRHFGESINIRYCMRETSLLIAYPSLGRLRLFAMYSPTKGYAGYFDPSRYGMMVCMGTANSPFEFQTEGVLLHEVQHLIQEEENFARGGDVRDIRYHRLAGEVEARNICIRHSLSPEQRRAKLYSDTQDVPSNMQFVVFSW
ncbi:MAG: hypothetical protein MJZ96_00020 [Paludibacteraceae bacterium]|nr:hypothetical protein [Paludibacteraceae bacterium]